jgi:hypothetical protein
VAGTDTHITQLQIMVCKNGSFEKNIPELQFHFLCKFARDRQVTNKKRAKFKIEEDQQ